MSLVASFFGTRCIMIWHSDSRNMWYIVNRVPTVIYWYNSVEVTHQYRTDTLDCFCDMWFRMCYLLVLRVHVVYVTRRLLPESVVWLYANNRAAEADQIIRNAAKLNNITMPDKILIDPDRIETAVSDGEKADDDARRMKGGKLLDKFRNWKNSRRSEKTQDQSARYTLLDIFRNRHLTINIFCMVFLWSVGYIMTFIWCFILWGFTVCFFSVLLWTLLSEINERMNELI